jgi:hypothetical protein
MKRNLLPVLLALFATSASAQVASLPAVFGQAQKAVKQAPKGRHFDLIWERGRWRFLMNPNPPGSGLLLDLYEGEHVRLTFTDQAFFNVADETAMFDIDEVKVHVYLQSAGDQAQAEFDAPKQGIYFIKAGQTIIGRMIVHKP